MLDGVPDTEHAKPKCEASSGGGQLEVTDVAGHDLELREVLGDIMGEILHWYGFLRLGTKSCTMWVFSLEAT